MAYMGSQKSSADHFLGVVFNEETHGDLYFSPFGRPYTVMKLQSQTPCITCPPPLTLYPMRRREALAEALPSLEVNPRDEPTIAMSAHHGGRGPRERECVTVRAKESRLKVRVQLILTMYYVHMKTRRRTAERTPAPCPIALAHSPF